MVSQDNANLGSDLKPIRDRLLRINDKIGKYSQGQGSPRRSLRSKSGRSPGVSGKITLAEIRKKLQAIDSRFQDGVGIQHIFAKLNDISNSQDKFKNEILETGTVLSGLIDNMDSLNKRLKEVDLRKLAVRADYTKGKGRFSYEDSAAESKKLSQEAVEYFEERLSQKIPTMLKDMQSINKLLRELDPKALKGTS